MKTITRADATSAGLKRYFTGEPCVRGHISERITINGTCHACFLENKQAARAKKPGYRTREELDARRDATVRVCTTCGEAFPATTEHFVLIKNKQRNWEGLSAECRECRNERFHPFYKKNRKRLIKRAIKDKKRRRKDPDFLVKDRQWSRDSARRRFSDPKQRAKVTARNRRWRKKNPRRVARFKHNHPAMKRERAMARRAGRVKNLSLADKKKIETIYLLADYLTKKTKIKYEVDHVYPLIHKTSCGLHVPWNMRIVTAKANQAKGNRLPV
jgi:hypothetical protein